MESDMSKQKRWNVQYEPSITVDIESWCTLERFKKQIEELISKFGRDAYIIVNYDNADNIQYEILKVKS